MRSDPARTARRALRRPRAGRLPVPLPGACAGLALAAPPQRRLPGTPATTRRATWSSCASRTTPQARGEGARGGRTGRRQMRCTGVEASIPLHERGARGHGLHIARRSASHHARDRQRAVFQGNVMLTDGRRLRARDREAQVPGRPAAGLTGDPVTFKRGRMSGSATGSSTGPGWASSCCARRQGANRGRGGRSGRHRAQSADGLARGGACSPSRAREGRRGAASS